MAETRLDPDSLLHRAQIEEKRKGHGRLKIFLGAAPGVGKTYAMLEEARKLSSERADIVIGYVEPHGRPDTAALVLGLDMLPARFVEHQGMQLREFDLDAALARKPAILVVDELAHTNAPASRHPKRWQDIEEVLDAGINVLTTLNIQHVESLRDLVAQITGVVVRETVPDSILDRADEIKLVDIAPNELLERLRAGKVYVPQQAERALESFFRRENLVALRELALRSTAERVNAELEDYRKSRGEHPVWSTTDRLLVCVGPSPFSSRLVRATRRMASLMKVPWLAVHVEKLGAPPMSEAARGQLSENLRLAEELGAEVVRIGGEKVAAEIVEYARQRNVTKIVVGKPLQPRWREALRGSFVYELTRRCGEIDVYVISGDLERTNQPAVRARPRSWSLASYAWALAAVGIATGVSFAMFPFFEQSNLVMVYLLAVGIVAAARGERGPAAVSSVLSVLAFDFCFVPPRFSFSVSDMQYLVTFGVMLGAGLLISGLTVRLRLQAEWSRQRESATAALYALSRTLAATQSARDIILEATRHLSSLFEARVVVLLRDDSGKLVPQDVGTSGFSLDDREMAVADWAAAHGQRAGRGTTTLPMSSVLWQPLSAANNSVGVVGLQPTDSAIALDPGRLHLLETFANQVALAVERANLAMRAKTSEMQVETERLRNALLSAVSHDLRTPLASIMGSSSTLLEPNLILSLETRQELAETIYEEAQRLNRLVGNLLDVTRLEAGAVAVRREWQPVEELIGVVLSRLGSSLDGHPVATRIPPDLPLLPVDTALMEQVLFNLLDNAVRHTPVGTSIEVSAEARQGEVVLSVTDSGPGVPVPDRERIFEKFQRGARGKEVGGTGLGLTVSKGIVSAHGGRIWVEQNPRGGAVFRFSVPIIGEPPSGPPDRPVASPKELSAGGS